MPNLSTILQSWRTALQNLPRHTVIIISLILGFGLILGLLVLFNGNSENSVVETQSSSSVNTAILRYEDNSLFTKVSTKAHSSEFIIFSGDKDPKTGSPQYFFQKPESTITNSGSLFETNGPFLQDSQYLLSKGELLINEGDGSYVFTNSDGKTTPIITPTGEKIQSVVQVTDIFDNTKTKEFYYMTASKEKTLTIKKTTKLDFKDSKDILTFDPKQLETQYDKLEIRIVNSSPFIFGYIYGNEQNLDIYRIDRDKLTKKLSIYNFDGIIMGSHSYNQYIFYTVAKESPDELGRYKYGIIDFGNTFSPKASYFEFTREPRLDNILGEVIANKCSWDNDGENIYCPIKVKKTISSASNQVDEIISYNVKNNTISYPYKDIGVSISRIFFGPDNSTYFVSQGSNNLFKVKK
jgi:hypothetical protein